MRSVSLTLLDTMKATKPMISPWGRRYVAEVNADEAISRLGRVNPVPIGSLVGLHESPAVQRAMREILALKPKVPWWKRRFIVFPLAAAVSLATAAASFELTRPVTTPTEVGCYAGATTHSPLHLHAMDQSPLVTCTRLWVDGKMGAPLDAPLVECVEPSGSAAVFSSSDPAVCSFLKLAEPVGGLSPLDQKIIVLNAGLAERSNSTTCLSLQEGYLEAVDLIKTVGLMGWKVIPPTSVTDVHPCTRYIVDAPNHLVSIELVPQATGNS